MQNAVLDCHQTRLRLQDYLDGAEACPAVAAHLAHCDACLEACLEAALRRPAEVPIPGGFTARTLDRLSVQLETTPSALPYALAAACGLFVMLGVTLVSRGMVTSLNRSIEQMRPEVLLSVLGVEAGLCLLWFWRVCKA